MNKLRQMILLERVKIIGFKSSASIVDVNLSGENVSIIYGDNGCGKTTFLKILHAIFAQEESVLLKNNIQQIILEYSEYDIDHAANERELTGQGTVNISRRRAFENEQTKKANCINETHWATSKTRIAAKSHRPLHQKTLFDDFESDDLTFDWSELLNSPFGDTTSISLGVDRGVNDRGAKIETRYIYEFFRSPRRRSYINDNYQVGEIAADLTRFLNNISNSKRRDRANLDLNKTHLDLQNIKIENIEALLVEKYRLARVMATKRIQNALFETLSVAVKGQEQMPLMESVPHDFNDLLIENSDRIIEALDDGEENRFKNTIIEILNNLKHNHDAVNGIRENKILTQLFLNIIEELKIERLILSSVNLLVDTFNNYLVDGKELRVSEHEATITYGIDSHGVESLSSGERHILTFLSLILFEGVKRDFVIIDEPEISLNIKWQRELIPLIEELIPATQIIVASHSPSLCNENMQLLCELVQERTEIQ